MAIEVASLEEIVDIIDEMGRTIKSVPRRQAHGRITKTSQVILYDSRGNVLITQRGRQKRFPEHWQISITETPRSGEPNQDAAIRGLYEELGVRQLRLEDLFEHWYRNPLDPTDRKNVTIFRGLANQVRPDGVEVIRAEFIPARQVGIEIGKRKFTPMIIETWGRYQSKYNATNYRP